MSRFICNYKVVYIEDLLTHIYVCALAATLVRLCVAAQVTEPHSGSTHGPPGGPCAPD